MPSYKGITIDLLVEGKKAEEHGLFTDDEKDVCNVYVVAQEGRSFSFDLDFSAIEATGHSYYLYIDGKRARKTSGLRSKVSVSEGHYYIDKNGSYESRKFYFGRLDTAEEGSDEPLQTDPEMVNKIGTLEWRYMRAKKGHRTQNLRNEGLRGAPVHPGTVSEKLIKGRPVSHVTHLGDPTVHIQQTKRKLKTARLDKANKPYASIIFHYSSEELLQAQGIIARPQFVRPGTPESEINSSLAPIINRMRNMVLKKPSEMSSRPKSEISSSNKDGLKKRRIKTISGKKGRPKTKLKEKPFIDLTSDI